MKVTAQPGAKCPMEHDPRAYITDGAPVDVPDTLYYRRLIMDGSLAASPEQSPDKPEAVKATQKKGGKE